MEVYWVLRIGHQQLEEYLSGSLIKNMERSRLKGLLGIFSESLILRLGALTARICGVRRDTGIDRTIPDMSGNFSSAM